MPIRSCHFMRRDFQTVTTFLLIITLTVTTQGQDTPGNPRTVHVKRGQVMEFSLLTSLDSARAQRGDDVSLTLTHPLVADGATVLPTGWIAHTKIKKAVAAGKNCKSGNVDWKLSRLDGPGNQKLKLQPIPEFWAKPNGQLVEHIALDSPSGTLPDPVEQWALVAIYLPILVLAGAYALIPEPCDGGSGSEVSVAAGTNFYFAISKDADLTVY